MQLDILTTEYEQAASDDSLRLEHFIGSLAAPGTPFKKFMYGNKESLEVIPKRAGVNIYALLRKHWETNFSAHRMTLAIQSYASFEELESLVRAHFEAIPKRSKPLAILGGLLADEGDGSILHTLRGKNFATEIYVFNNLTSTPVHSSFCTLLCLCIKLSKLGSKHWDQVCQVVFDYIKLLQDSIQSKPATIQMEDPHNPRHKRIQNNFMSYLEERKIIYESTFLYGEPEAALQCCMAVAELMQLVPIESVCSAPHILKKPDPAVRACYHNFLVRKFILQRLLLFVLEQHLREVAYEGEVASMWHSLKFSVNGLLIEVSGFSGKFFLFYSTLLRLILEKLPILSDAQFNMYKDSVKQTLFSLLADPSSVSRFVCGYLLQKDSYRIEQLTQCLQNLSTADVFAFKQHIFMKLHINAYVYGNVTEKNVLRGPAVIYLRAKEVLQNASGTLSPWTYDNDGNSHEALTFLTVVPSGHFSVDAVSGVVDAFFYRYAPLIIAGMSDKEFRNIIEDMISMERRSDTNIWTEYDRNRQEILFNETPLFARREHKIKVLKEVTQEELLEFYVSEYVDQACVKSLIIQIDSRTDGHVENTLRRQVSVTRPQQIPVSADSPQMREKSCNDLPISLVSSLLLYDSKMAKKRFNPKYWKDDDLHIRFGRPTMIKDVESFRNELKFEPGKAV
ncbi:nardilysin [Paragonimus westermani]|uniref:Nardilysin n=1 Tax=Paragonimus westermani TaxID=34504 RepID=A0A5J4P0E1_9TREM|nr:nardilysin [Paragonimus westermani]